VIDSGEKQYVFDAFEELGVPYIKAEIKFYHCKACKKVDFKPFEECPNCGGRQIISERAGDYTNTNRTFLVEKKKPQDFVASMLDKSLHDQAAKMARYFEGWKFLFLEGFISVMADDPHNKNLRGWIKSMRVTLRQYDICMWQIDDIYEVVRELERLDKKCGEAPQIHETLDDKYTGWSDQKKIICKLLDVSNKKADTLLEIFNSPWEIFKAIIESGVLYTRTGNLKGVIGAFENVKGFGPKFIQKNKEMLLNENHV